LLHEKTRAVALPLLGLTAGQLTGRRNTAKFKIILEYLKIENLKKLSRD